MDFDSLELSEDNNIVSHSHYLLTPELHKIISEGYKNKYNRKIKILKVFIY